jgi:transposase
MLQEFFHLFNATDNSPYGARVERAALCFRFNNPRLSVRQCSGSEGLRNGAKHFVSYGTLKKWLHLYKKWGTLPSLSKKLRRKAKGGRKSLNAEQIRYLLSLARSNPEWYLDEYQTDLMANGMPKIHTSTIYRILKSNGLSLRVLKRVARERSELEIAQFYERIQHLDMSRVLFVDETAKDNNAARRRRGWCVTCSDAEIIESLHARHHPRYTIIAAMNLDGFVPQACMRVHRDKENVDMELFNYYLENHLLPVMGNFYGGEKNSILILDNAPVHDQDYIRERVNSVGAIVIFTAKYAPHINPIEYGFHILKADMKRSSRYLSGDRLYWMAISSVTRKKILPTYRHCFPNHYFADDSDDSNETISTLINIGIGVGVGIATAMELEDNDM